MFTVQSVLSSVVAIDIIRERSKKSVNVECVVNTIKIGQQVRSITY